MDKGTPTIATPHKICEKGKMLTSEQAQLLKLIGERMVVFRVGLLCYWDSATSEVTQIEGGGIQEDEGDELESDDAMSE
jgi:mRNA turnover protein 4